MNFYDVQREHPEIWQGTSIIMDAVVTSGIDNSYTRAEREMIFAYISEDNGCAFCAKHHKDLAYDLGFDDSFTKENYADTPAKQKNVSYIAAAANFMNQIVIDFGVTQINDKDIMLRETPVRNRGYKVKNRYMKGKD